MKSKLLIILIDGLGDVALRELDDKTPLQLARTPHMDSLTGMQ
jgi:2,3-bisphosphoglycerate-independent phosphoglycerate mutase